MLGHGAGRTGMSTSSARSSSSVWSRFKQDDCPVCSQRGWCRETRKSDGSRIVECMHEHDSSRPGFIKSKPNSRGEQASYYRLDGPIIPEPSLHGNGKHNSAERADE